MDQIVATRLKSIVALSCEIDTVSHAYLIYHVFVDCTLCVLYDRNTREHGERKYVRTTKADSGCLKLRTRHVKSESELQKITAIRNRHL